MERYLRKCLDSLIVSDENMQLLEVLVINDGSKDSSSQIAHEYENKYPQTFRVINKENGNYGSCINRGLKEAKGKYVKILDADDYSEAIALEEYLSYLKELDADLVLSDFDVVDPDGKILQNKSYTSLISQEDGVVSFINMINNRSNIALSMHAITYRLKLLVDMEYAQTEGISYTDQEWATMPIIHVKTVAYFHQTLYKYLIGREGQTMASYLEVKNHNQLFIVIRNIARLYEAQSHDFAYNAYLEEKIMKLMATIYYAGLRDKTISKEELIVYDSQLKCYPKSYALTDKIKLIRNHISFVKHWHSDNKLTSFLCVEIPIIIRNFCKR